MPLLGAMLKLDREEGIAAGIWGVALGSIRGF